MCNTLSTSLGMPLFGIWDLWYNISTLNLRHPFSNFKRSFSTFKCTHSLSAYVYPLAPEIVVVTSYQSINQSINHHCHGHDFSHQAIIVPQNSSFGFTCSSFKRLVMLEAVLSKKQWSPPLIIAKSC